MGRQKPNKPRRTRPQDFPGVEALYSDLREMAEKSVQEATERLLAAGAHQSDIDGLKGSMRALCVSDMWDQDIHGLVELAKGHERGPFFIFDVLADAVLPDPDELYPGEGA